MNVRKTTLVWQSSIKKKKLFDKLWQPPPPPPLPAILRALQF